MRSSSIPQTFLRRRPRLCRALVAGGVLVPVVVLGAGVAALPAAALPLVGSTPALTLLPSATPSASSTPSSTSSATPSSPVVPAPSASATTPAVSPSSPSATASSSASPSATASAATAPVVVSSKADLQADLQGTAGGSWQLGSGTWNAVDTAHDVIAIPANATVVLDLDGQTLSLDSISLGTGASLMVRDTAAASTGGLTLSGSIPAAVGGVATNAPGIGLATSSALVVDGATVSATGGALQAGIGTSALSAAVGATVDVKGAADVTALGGVGAAGIGGGLAQAGVAVTVESGATVTATNGAAYTPLGGTPVIGSAIGAGANAVVGGPAAMLTVAPGGTVVIPVAAQILVPVNAVLLNGGSLDVRGTLSVLSGGVLHTLSTGSVSVAGTALLAGQLLNDGVLTVAGTLSVLGTGLLTNTGSLVLDHVLQLALGGSIDNAAAGLIDVESAITALGGTVQNQGEIFSLTGNLSDLLQNVTVTGVNAVTSITTDLAGGTAGLTPAIPTSISVMATNLAQLAAWVPVRSGWNFTGWSTTGGFVTSATDLSQGGVLALVAQWAWATPISVLSGNSFSFTNGQVVTQPLVTGSPVNVVVLNGGVLPAGLSIDQGGVLTGTAQNASASDVVSNIVLEFTGPGQSAIDKAYSFTIASVGNSSSSSSGNSSSSSSSNTSSSSSNSNNSSNSSSNSSNSSGSGNSSSSTSSGPTTTTTTTTSNSSNSSNSSTSSSSNSSSSSTSGSNNTTTSGSNNTSTSTSTTSSSKSGSTASSSDAKAAAHAAALGLVTRSSLTSAYGRPLQLALKSPAKVSARYKVIGKLPKGVTFNSRTATVSGKPKQTGSFNFKVQAVSPQGTVTVGYCLVIPAKVVFGAAVSNATPLAGGTTTVQVTRLTAGQHVTLRIGGRVVGTGTASGGTARIAVRLPKSSVDRTVVIAIGVSGAAAAGTTNSGSISVTALAAAKRLTATAHGGLLTVTGLARGEAVRVTVGGRVVASGTASAGGVFTTRKAKVGQTVVVHGATASRSVTAVVR